MINNTSSKIIGEQLRKARNSLGLSIPEVAVETGFDSGEILNWENEESEPSIEHLWELARLFHRSTDFFLRDTAELPTHINFRLTNQKHIRELPLQAREAIVHFEELCRNEFELEKTLNKVHVTNIDKFHNQITPDLLATGERNRLNLSDKPIRDIRRLLTRMGARVFLLPIIEKKLSGLSWWHSDHGPCILVNAYDEPRGRRAFTMAHELAHLIRDDMPVVCDLEFQSPEEDFANVFASHFLIPASDLREAYGSTVGPPLTLPNNEQLGILANRYGVSLEALSRRLENIQLIARGSTERYIDEWNKAPRRFRGAKGPRWKRQLGEKYVSLAFDAYSGGNISVGKLAQFLGVDVRTALNETQNKS